MSWQSQQNRRGPALTGACFTAACCLGALGWEGALSWPVLAAAGFGIAASTLFAGLGARADLGPRPTPSAEADAATLPVFPDPVIMVDRRSVVVDANEPARAILPGLKLRQPLSFALRDPGVLATIPLVLATGDPHNVEYGGRVPGEPSFEVRLRRLVPAEDAELSDPTVALFFRDLTAERRTEAMRVDFVANVSHELRTPLASLVGFIDTLQGPARGDTAARERFLKIMATQAARMTRLIDDLLQLSRVELKEHVPPSTPVDLAGTLAHMIEVMAPLATERGVRIALDLPDGPVHVLGDRDELLRLIENLVENAIKYGGAGGGVEVSLRRLPGEGSNGRVELKVRDHGPGIAPEHLPRLTERFYRVDVADSRSQGGTGLGLAIVKHIVARHRGRFLIESKPGEGATMRVSLPEHGP